MAKAILRIVGNPKPQRLGAATRAKIMRDYSLKRRSPFVESFRRAIRFSFGSVSWGDMISSLQEGKNSRRAASIAEDYFGHQHVTVIEPTSGWRLLDLRELWAYRELFWVLTARDVKVRYKQTVL